MWNRACNDLLIVFHGFFSSKYGFMKTMKRLWRNPIWKTVKKTIKNYDKTMIKPSTIRKPPKKPNFAKRVQKFSYYHMELLWKKEFFMSWVWNRACNDLVYLQSAKLIVTKYFSYFLFFSHCTGNSSRDSITLGHSTDLLYTWYFNNICHLFTDIWRIWEVYTMAFCVSVRVFFFCGENFFT